MYVSVFLCVCVCVCGSSSVCGTRGLGGFSGCIEWRQAAQLLLLPSLAVAATLQR